MLSTVELDYIQHLERGYCENHPDVIAQTKDQVVDRAVKQLLTALQSNGFELDGNILKRGNGWLQYDATSSAWQYSNDAGVTWQDMGSGGGGVPFFGLRNPSFNSLVGSIPLVTSFPFTIAGVFDLDFNTTGQSLFYTLKNASNQTIFQFGYDHDAWELFVYLGSVRVGFADVLSYQRLGELGIISDPANNRVAFFSGGKCSAWQSVTPAYPVDVTTGQEFIGPIKGDLYWVGLAEGFYHAIGAQDRAISRGRSQWNGCWRYWGLVEGMGTTTAGHRASYADIQYTITAGEWIGVQE